jgi:signal transduction histidine kinase
MCLPTASAEYRAKSQARIRKQIERINELITELLVFSHGPEKGLVVARLDFAPTLRRFVTELEPEITARNCRLALANEPPAVRVMLDTKRMMRVLFNLITNATEVMGPRVSSAFPARAGVVTELADTGGSPEVAGQAVRRSSRTARNGTGWALDLQKSLKITVAHLGA